MKYKVGDRVRIKSLDWYNKNKDDYGSIYAGNGFCFWKNMARHCGEIMKITIVKVDPEDSNKGYYFMENSEERWTDEMIEGLAEEETKPNIIEEAKTYWDSIKDAWICPQGYQFVDENGNIINAQKIVLEKKKQKYPETYEECAEIIAEFTGSDCNPKGCMGYMSAQLTALQKLLICRDAYWKIAGEEMGLDEPWEPDWTIQKLPKYCIAGVEGQIKTAERYIVNTILAFPTAEMRDAFYEVFREEIEICKELL